MKTLLRWFISLAFVALICFVGSEQKLDPINNIGQTARGISRCTSEAARIFFTPSNEVLIVTQDEFYLGDALREILIETSGNRTNEISTNLWSNETDESELRTKYSSFLVIIESEELHNLFENSSAKRWAEYVVVTEATSSWLLEFAEHLRNLGFIKVAIVRVTSKGSSSVPCMVEYPLSQDSPPTLKAERQNQNMTTYNKLSWRLQSPIRNELLYARILEGTEKSNDFTKLKNGVPTSFGGDVIEIFAERYDLKLVKVSWENQVMSSWRDAMIRCMAGEIDVFYSVLPAPVGSYGGDIEPLYWYKFQALVFFYSPKKHMVSLTSLLTPFSNTLWLCNIAIFGVFALFALSVDFLSRRGLIRQRITVLDIWAISMVQSVAFVPAKFGLRFVLGMWILHSLSNALLYSGTFSSSLTATSHNYLKDFRDIIRSGKRICGAGRSKVLMQNTNNSLLHQISDRFEEMPSINVVNKAINEDYIGTAHLSYLDRHNWVNRRNDSRQLRIINNAVINTYPVMYYAKKHEPFNRDFHQTIMIAHETGLIMKAQEKFKMKLQKSPDEVALSSADQQVLKLTHIKVAFEILGIGYLISGLVFLAEIYRHKRSAKKLANRKSKREESTCFRSSGEPDSLSVYRECLAKGQQQNGRTNDL